MFIVGAHHLRRFHHCLFVIVISLLVAGCEYEHVSPAPPIEVLPSLLCASYVQSGYTDKPSYFAGEKMQIFLESWEDVHRCRLILFDIQGDSVFSIASFLPLMDSIHADASENGFNLRVAVEVVVPKIKSGVYLIERRIPFIIKAVGPVDLTIVYPSNTANAYSQSGGQSLYYGSPPRTAISFQRPVELQSFTEFCLKWFTTLQDFRIGYVSDSDMDDFENIRQSEILVIPGHSEYWTRAARQNFDHFVESGGHSLILSGNTMWWQVRYSEDKNKMICYKNIVNDPMEDPLFKTIEWSTPSLEYSLFSSIGASFSNGGYGLRDDKGWNGYKIVRPHSPLFEGTDLKKGDTIHLPSVEYDGAPLLGFDEEGYPIVDTVALNFEKFELLGFDKGYRGKETTATFIIFRKTSTTGIVINTATTDWCSANGMGGLSENIIKTITLNALTKLLNDEPVFCL